MPFGVVSGVGLGMGVFDFGGDRRRGGAVLGVNLGRPIVTNGAFVMCSSQITLRTCYRMMLCERSISHHNVSVYLSIRTSVHHLPILHQNH